VPVKPPYVTLAVSSAPQTSGFVIDVPPVYERLFGPRAL